MDGCDALIAVISHSQLVDFNVGLFQAWWEGAIMFSNHPDEPNEATQVVEDLMGRTYDRLGVRTGVLRTSHHRARPLQAARSFAVEPLCHKASRGNFTHELQDGRCRV